MVLVTCVDAPDIVGTACTGTGTDVVVDTGTVDVTPIGVVGAGTVGVVAGVVCISAGTCIICGVAGAGSCIICGVAGVGMVICGGAIIGVVGGVVFCAADGGVACPLSTPFPRPWLLLLSIFVASSSKEFACERAF